MWHFKTLPYHPILYDGESLGSYLCRVSQNNKIINIPSLQKLLFPDVHIRNLRNFNEFKPGNMSHFYSSLNLNSNMMKKTFWNLSDNFGRPKSPQVSSKFLSSLITHNRKFCPLCLGDENKILLVWKFNSVEICLNHEIYLINECQTCRVMIKNLPKNLSNLLCPNCNSDLRKSNYEQNNSIKKLNQQKNIQNNFGFLLQKNLIKQNGQFVKPSSKIIGRKLKKIRKEKNCSVPLFSKISDMKIHDIENLEYGLISRGIGDLKKYFSYLSGLEMTVMEFYNY